MNDFQRILARAAAGEYMHPATLAMAKADQAAAPRCLTCLDWNLRASPQHARVGLAACAHGETFVFLDANKTCSKHRPASAEITQGRQAYFDKQKAKA